jgi:dipeptidyl aminopeptidase/acylaminoacyl peptidase
VKRSLHRAATFTTALALPILTAMNAVPALAGPPPLIPRETLFGNPDRATPRLSPDGTKLAYLKADGQNVLQVWVKTIGKNDDKQITQDPKRGVRQYLWAYDNTHVLYLQDNDGDENFHIFAADLLGGETRDLTPVAGARAVPLTYEPTSPNEMIVLLNGRNKRDLDPYKLNIVTGKLDLIAENPGNVGGWIFDSKYVLKGRTLLKPDGGTDLELRASETAPWTKAASWTSDDVFFPIDFDETGTKLYAIGNLESNTATLVAMDVATGKSTPLASDPKADAQGIMQHPVTHALQGVQFNYLRSTWKPVGDAVTADLAALSKLSPGDFTVSSRDLKDKTWIVAYTLDNGPVKWFTWDRTAQKGTFLFSNRTELEKQTLATMQGVEIKSRDGLTLPSYLTLPPGVPAKNLPAVLYVHGGPWARDNWGYEPTVQWMANRGYAVLQVNYRGSIGFGKAFKNAAKHEFAGKMHDDLLDGVDYLVKQGIADPKRIGILGGSYGGYATLVGLSFTPNTFACGVDICGPSSLASLIESFPPYWGPYLASTWYPFVGNPKDEKERADMLARSPITKAEQIKSPLLIGQGAKDPRVTQKESDSMVEALRKRGVSVEYVVYPDEGHGFQRPPNRLDFFGKAETFLAKHLGGRAEASASAAIE